jgi:hypothetical protein
MKAVWTRNPSLEHIKAKLFEGFQYENKQTTTSPCSENLNQKTLFLAFYSNLLKYNEIDIINERDPMQL